jgi:Arc/MetJ-type ribon-helix-helix transcriptional regulator
LKLITLYLPTSYIELLDGLVTEQFYPNRAEAIRISVRGLLLEHNKFDPKSSDYKVPSKRKLAEVEREVKSQSKRGPKRPLKRRLSR